MDLDDYQERAHATAIYPGADGSDDRAALSYLALGLTSEAGEVAGKVKKILRDLPDSHPISPAIADAVMSEVGDTLWYLAEIGTILGLSLGYQANANLEKLADRAERGVLGGSGDTR